MLALVENSAFVGNVNKSPFNFKPYDLREISIQAGGKQWPTTPYDLNYGNYQFTRAFYDMFEASGLANTTESNGISLKKYKSGWTIYVMNLTNSGEDDQCFDLLKEGTTSVSIKFRSPVPAGGLVLIAMGDMDSLLMVDKNRSVSSDATVV